MTAKELLAKKGITPESKHHDYSYLYDSVLGIIEQAQKGAYNQALIDAKMLGKVELVLVKSGEHPIYEYRINWESLKKLMK